MEHAVAGRGAAAVEAQCGRYVGMTLAVCLARPYYQRHVQLVERRERRCVQEQATAVVEDVLAVVGGVEHGRAAAVPSEHGYDVGQQLVGVGYGVVVGVDELCAQFFLRALYMVGLEACERLWVAVLVVEVRAVGVQYDEHTPVLAACENPRQGCHHAAVGRHQGLFVTQEQHLVGLFAEEVDERVVALLVGYEHRVVPGLAESCRYALRPVEYVVVLCRCRRQQYGHALVRGVALAHVVGKHREAADGRQPGVGVPPIAVELPVVGAARLAYDAHYDLRHGVRRLARGVVAEVAHGLDVLCRGFLPSERHAEVAACVDGEYVVGGRESPCGRGPSGEQQCRRQPTQRHLQRPPYERPVCLPVPHPSHDAHGYRRDVYYHHPHYGRYELREQLAHLARVGGHEVEPHIHGYGAAAV